MVNILAAAGIAELDDAHTVRIRVGGLPQDPQPPLNYQIVYSLHGVLDYYTTLSWVLRDGEPLEVDALSEIEPVEFPEPVGTLEAFHTAGGLSTMPWTYKDRLRNMEYKTLRYPGHAEAMRVIRELGLLSLEPVDVNGTVVPRDVFIACAEPRLRKPEHATWLRCASRPRARRTAPHRVVFDLIDYSRREYRHHRHGAHHRLLAAITGQMQASRASSGPFPAGLHRRAERNIAIRPRGSAHDYARSGYNYATAEDAPRSWILGTSYHPDTATFLEDRLVVAVHAEAPGELQVVRGQRGRIEVAARSRDGFAGFGLGGSYTRQLRLTAVGSDEVQYLVVVPEHVAVSVQLPSGASTQVTDSDGVATYHWGRRAGDRAALNASLDRALAAVDDRDGPLSYDGPIAPTTGAGLYIVHSGRGRTHRWSMFPSSQACGPSPSAAGGGASGGASGRVLGAVRSVSRPAGAFHRAQDG
jgi:hypothetical protein